jgi:hypothetical protein
MMTFGGVKRGGPAFAAESRADRRMQSELPPFARSLALAGLIAGGALLLPATAGAAAPDAKPETSTAPAGGERKVSPYVIAARRHREAPAAAGEHSIKRPLGQLPQKKTAQPKRH